LVNCSTNPSHPCDGMPVDELLTVMPIGSARNTLGQVNISSWAQLQRRLHLVETHEFPLAHQHFRPLRLQSQRHNCHPRRGFHSHQGGRTDGGTPADAHAPGSCKGGKTERRPIVINGPAQSWPFAKGPCDAQPPHALLFARKKYPESVSIARDCKNLGVHRLLQKFREALSRPERILGVSLSLIGAARGSIAA
jgi:hypothetical protein